MSELAKNEVQNMGSLNHSIVQARLTGQLDHEERFTTMIELSLDISQTDLSQFSVKAKDELKPDICLYPNHVGLSELTDILKMSEMPLLAIEILSPKQGIDEILAKFKAYFTLGVKSCWLVTPALKTISVYSAPSSTGSNLFDARRDSELIDEVMGIHLSIQKIFR
jgi:Uma2 family endonuclease